MCILQVVIALNEQEGGGKHQCWLEFLREASSSNAKIIANIKTFINEQRVLCTSILSLGSMSYWHKDFITMATGHWTNEIISCHGNIISILLPPGTCSTSSHPPTTSCHLSSPFFFHLVTLLFSATYVWVPKFMARCVYEIIDAKTKGSDFVVYSFTIDRENLWM